MSTQHIEFAKLKIDEMEAKILSPLETVEVLRGRAILLARTLMAVVSKFHISVSKKYPDLGRNFNSEIYAILSDVSGVILKISKEIEKKSPAETGDNSKTTVGAANDYRNK